MEAKVFICSGCGTKRFSKKALKRHRKNCETFETLPPKRSSSTIHLEGREVNTNIESVAVVPEKVSPIVKDNPIKIFTCSGCGAIKTSRNAYRTHKKKCNFHPELVRVEVKDPSPPNNPEVAMETVEEVSSDSSQNTEDCIVQHLHPQSNSNFTDVITLLEEWYEKNNDLFEKPHSEVVDVLYERYGSLGVCMESLQTLVQYGKYLLGLVDGDKEKDKNGRLKIAISISVKNDWMFDAHVENVTEGVDSEINHHWPPFIAEEDKNMFTYGYGKRGKKFGFNRSITDWDECVWRQFNAKEIPSPFMPEPSLFSCDSIWDAESDNEPLEPGYVLDTKNVKHYYPFFLDENRKEIGYKSMDWYERVAAWSVQRIETCLVRRRRTKSYETARCEAWFKDEYWRIRGQYEFTYDPDWGIMRPIVMHDCF